MRSQKFRLRLTSDQESLCWWYSKVARNYWNLLVDIDKRNNLGEFDEYLSGLGNKVYYSEYYERNIYSLTSSDYLKLAKVVIANSSAESPDKWSWYYQPNQSFIYSFIAKELVTVRRRNKGKLNFRSINDLDPSFNVRCDAHGKQLSRIHLKHTGYLQIPTLGEVKFGSTRDGYDLNCKKQTAKVSFDGKYWYLSYTEPTTLETEELPDFTEGIGVDLGIKTLATVSTGMVVPNIKTFRRIRILTKRLKRYQRKLSRKYLINNCNRKTKTKNIIKLEREIKLIHRSILNIRKNHIREFVSRLVKTQPMYIAIEDLNVKGMMRNKHLAKDIANCSFYAIREHLVRKAKERNIMVRLVDRFFPSSKMCSSCGHIKQDLKLSQRVYNCSSCGVSIDRDFNASLNLSFTDKYTLA